MDGLGVAVCIFDRSRSITITGIMAITSNPIEAQSNHKNLKRIELMTNE